MSQCCSFQLRQVTRDDYLIYNFTTKFDSIYPATILLTPSMELKSNTSDNISRIKHLSQLFKSLPNNLPLNPANSRYKFGLDSEELEEYGHWYALNHNLEICFQTHKLRGEPLKFTERGKSFDALLKVLQNGMREAPGDAELIMNWVERLIAAAMVSGATIVKQMSK